jgi:predicted kinase
VSRLIITRGLPGSGKTTWAKAWVADSEKRARVNRDDIRIEQLGMDPSQGVLDYKGETLVTEIQQTTVRKYLRFDIDVVVDDTNLRAKNSRAWADLAREEGAEFDVKDFFHVDPLECFSRTERRALNGGRGVPFEVIDTMHKKFLAKGPLPPVECSPIEELETRKYTPDLLKPAAWIFDIDGTLAQMSSERSPYDWHKVGLDTCHESVREVLWILQSSGDDIIIVSGRDEGCRVETEKWLAQHEIHYNEFYMRPTGDNRKDTIVKAEIFWNSIAPHFNVRGVFDDRNSVVAMWRSLGIKTYQVELGDF